MTNKKLIDAFHATTHPIKSEPSGESRKIIITGFNEKGEEIKEEVEIPSNGDEVTSKNVYWPPKIIEI